MSFNVQSFIADMSVRKVLDLSRENLLAVLDHYKVEVESDKKGELQFQLITYLTENHDLEGSFSVPSGRIDPNPNEVRLKELQLAQDKAKYDFELSKLRMERLPQTVIDAEESRQPKFDVTKNLRLVPQFYEADVHKYFLHFEKTARAMEWPSQYWTIMLQSVLTGRAQEVYTTLSLEQSADYKIVKATIMKTYEQVPEAYRQNFRNLRKTESQTYLEYARVKTMAFKKWYTAQGVDTFEKLIDLMVLEEFKKSIPQDIRQYLNEHEVNKADEAAILADNYALTHRLSFKPRQEHRYDGASRSYAPRGFSNQSSKQSRYNPPPANSQSYSKSLGPTVTCAYCHKQGHVISECFKKKKQYPAPNAFVYESQRPVVTSKDREDKSVLDKYHPFMSKGSLASVDHTDSKTVDVLRDTGASRTLVKESVLPKSCDTYIGSNVIMQGIDCKEMIVVPLHKIYLSTPLVTGVVIVGARPDLPVPEVDVLLGNDLAGSQVVAEPVMTDLPDIESKEDASVSMIFPSCVVTRSQSRPQQIDIPEVDLADTVVQKQFEQVPTESNVPKVDKVQTPPSKTVKSTRYVSCSKQELIRQQKLDIDIGKLRNLAVSEEEIRSSPEGFYLAAGVLMRKYRHPSAPADEEWGEVHQVVVPPIFRNELLSLAHDGKLAGHLGIKKTSKKLSDHYYWPSLETDVKNYCKSCDTCQRVGKPNQSIPKFPLQPIPVLDEPFSRVIIDCVGPLPRTKSGYSHMLTVMCTATRFPEAVPIKNTQTETIAKELIKFFTLVGIPKEMQSDRGTNFTSKILQQVCEKLGIRQCLASAYHPESQGALERFHQTLKSMLKKYCLENQDEWDLGVPYVLFAVRESVQESLGFSPYELVFGRKVRGPLALVKQLWTGNPPKKNLIDYVNQVQHRLVGVSEIARQNFGASQKRMKAQFDKRTKHREFRKGDLVLALIPTDNDPFKAKYMGPYVVLERVKDTTYYIETPDRRKHKQLCHINMLKKYVSRDDNDVIVNVACDVTRVNDVMPRHECAEGSEVFPSVKMSNSEVLGKLGDKFSHLAPNESKELQSLIKEYDVLFNDTPSVTHLIEHDIDVGDAKPIKKHPYRVNPLKAEAMNSEIQYMLDHNIISPSQSDWSSPCLLVPKPGTNQWRLVSDFRGVNSQSRSDNFPIPRVEDCIDKIGKSRYVTKIDLLKGYYQIPLTDRAKRISTIITPKGLYHYNVMPFGLRNAPATFQRLINRVIADLDHCEAYIDDVIIATETWEDHIRTLRAFFERLVDARLTINLAKSEFGKATVQYLGYVVGQGHVKPVEAKVEAISKFPAPTSKKGIMRFLGMAGYYRKFCANFSEVAAPLTSLLKKDRKFLWSEMQEIAFQRIKAILMNAPVLHVADCNKQFVLSTDASDVGIGAVLQQEDGIGVLHPIAYFSKKFDRHQKNYSTVEKETLALVLALQHFEVYLSITKHPILVFTDHNPLTFVRTLRNKNQRIMRWSLVLEAHLLVVKHIKGTLNVVADALSRVE